MVNIYIETYGCSANQSHSEVMSGILERSGCNLVDNIELSDLIIINTCIVKDPTEKKIVRRLQEIEKEYSEKKLVIAGCMPMGNYKQIRNISDKSSLIGPNNCLDVLKCVRRTMKGEIVEYLDEKRECKLKEPRTSFNELINIVEISQGCLGECAYCIVKKCKGRLESYLIEGVKENIENSLENGYKELWLTSQDCGCYGLDIGVTLVDLLKEIEKIKGKFKVRVGMINPNHIANNLGDLIECFKSDKIYKFLHLPVQSGSNNVLKKMNRFYTREDFREIVNRFRGEIPKLSVWTDVIVGFPGETEEKFSETLDLIRETKPDFVNVSKFGVRPGTEAEKMKQVEPEKIKERTKKMIELVEKIKKEQNKKWVEEKCKVLITEKKGNQYFGRNESYKPVVLLSDKDLRGEIVRVKISGLLGGYLKGEVI